MKISFYTIVLVISCMCVGFLAVGVVLYNSHKLNLKQQQLQESLREELRIKEANMLLKQWLMSLDLYLNNREAYIYDSLVDQGEAITFLNNQFKEKKRLKVLNKKINAVLNLCSVAHQPGKRKLNENEWVQIISKSDALTEDLYQALNLYSTDLIIRINKEKVKINSRQITLKRTLYICPTAFIIFTFLIIKWSNKTIADPIKLLKTLASKEEISTENFPYKNPVELKSLADTLKQYVHDLEKAKELAWSKTKQVENINIRISSIMETAADAIICSNAKGEIFTMNASFRDLVSLEKNDSDKMYSCDDFIDEINLENYHFNTDNKKVLTEQKSLESVNGEKIKIELSVSTFKIDENIFFTLIIRDIREREQMQAQLLQSQKMDSIGILASGIAHEINTPIQYITNYCLFLQESYDDILEYLKASHELDSKQKEALYDEMDLDFVNTEIPVALNGSLEGLKKVSDIVKSMKIMAHPSKAKKIDYDVNSLIKEAVLLSKNEWGKNAKMEMILDDNIPKINCFPGFLSQTFINIIINAAHAIEAQVKQQQIATDGKIKIISKLKDQEIIIKFIDTGTGINDKIRTKIFDPFFTTKDVGVGTGQGLALSHDFIVNKHNGEIDFSSNSGLGCTFLITLPFEQKNA
ncbi:ATP-binding protein [Lentisphaera profundi]|uniref:histidine kinase n=1 Tax=Lentisphaera profundi TaxID=1658616 RepID=A0ABY7VTH5_9BACT|nr:ATP-binding protein [Lentisphaera profundi]WDE97367.1 ATP-binding protein [Lentisphaera profundi]